LVRRGCAKVSTISLAGGNAATARKAASTASRVKYIDTPSQEKKVGRSTSTPMRVSAACRGSALKSTAAKGGIRRSAMPAWASRLALHLLTCRLVHLDDAQLACLSGLPVGERVEPGAEDDVLPDVVRDVRRERVLRESAAQQDMRAGRVRPARSSGSSGTASGLSRRPRAPGAVSMLRRSSMARGPASSNSRGAIGSPRIRGSASTI